MQRASAADVSDARGAATVLYQKTDRAIDALCSLAARNDAAGATAQKALDRLRERLRR